MTFYPDAGLLPCATRFCSGSPPLRFQSQLCIVTSVRSTVLGVEYLLLFGLLPASLRLGTLLGACATGVELTPRRGSLLVNTACLIKGSASLEMFMA